MSTHSGSRRDANKEVIGSRIGKMRFLSRKTFEDEALIELSGDDETGRLNGKESTCFIDGNLYGKDGKRKQLANEAGSVGQ